MSSLALASDDAGTAWREPVERMPATGFEAIQFLNERQGWIAAQPQAQFPSDPFLLSTSDGGANWQKLPIWSEEGRAGLLQRFYFDGKDHGFVLIDRSQAGSVTDRYELYETPNAGASWMLRETGSRPITPKWPGRPAPQWRIREDGKAKTYELERRLGETWRRMANFRTDLGVCKSLEANRPDKAREGAPAAPEAPPNPDRKSTRLNSSHIQKSRMPSSA